MCKHTTARILANSEDTDSAVLDRLQATMERRHEHVADRRTPGGLERLRRVALAAPPRRIRGAFGPVNAPEF